MRVSGTLHRGRRAKTTCTYPFCLLGLSRSFHLPVSLIGVGRWVREGGCSQKWSNYTEISRLNLITEKKIYVKKEVFLATFLTETWP